MRNIDEILLEIEEKNKKREKIEKESKDLSHNADEMILKIEEETFDKKDALYKKSNKLKEKVKDLERELDRARADEVSGEIESLKNILETSFGSFGEFDEITYETKEGSLYIYYKYTLSTSTMKESISYEALKTVSKESIEEVAEGFKDFRKDCDDFYLPLIEDDEFIDFCINDRVMWRSHKVNRFQMKVIKNSREARLNEVSFMVRFYDRDRVSKSFEQYKQDIKEALDGQVERND